MKFDLTQNLADLSTWDFTLVIGGVDYVTRALTPADYSRIQAITIKATPGDEDLAFALGLFASEPKPPVADAAWRDENLSAAIAAILGYFKGMASKKCRAIAQKVAIAAQQAA